MSDRGPVRAPDSGEGLVVGIVGDGRLASAVSASCAAAGMKPLTFPRHALPSADWELDVLVDASGPEAQDTIIRFCRATGTPLVECVSNLGPGHWTALAALARTVTVLRATNLSLGNYLQKRLVRDLAVFHRASGVPVEAAVWERHPTTKAHRPSATAAALADSWAQTSGQPVAEVSSQRAGLPVSAHELTLTWPSETLTVRHAVNSLTAAGHGAVCAIRWVVRQPPRLADMHDVFNDLYTAG